MADQTSKSAALDDWDNLPLDPTADDWDDSPPATVQGQVAAARASSPDKADWPEDLARGEGALDDLDDDQSAEPANDDDDEFLDLAPLAVPEESSPLATESLGPEDSWDRANEPLEAGPLATKGQKDSLAATTNKGQKDSLSQTPLALAAKSAPGPEDSWDQTDQPLDAGQESSLGPDDSWDQTDQPLDAGQESPLGPEDSWDQTDHPLKAAQESALGPEDSLGVAKKPKDSSAEAIKAEDEGFDFEDALKAESQDSDAAKRLAAYTEDSTKSDFLKSLGESDSDELPRKVELDLDGIFNEAKKEAENLSPEATHLPDDAPEPPPAPTKAPEQVPPPKPQVVKFASYKLFIFIGILVVAASGLTFGVYNIFFKKNAPPSPPREEIVFEDDLAQPKAKVPGVFKLDRFLLSLGPDEDETVVEMEILLHYRDEPVVEAIKNETLIIRDLIFRVARTISPGVVTDADIRRQLQANLLKTLNNLPSFQSDPADPSLTYVQISLLKKR
ncbi:MAG: hypothetical protein LBI10_00040 [Deltaproteobacteria bacterium]|jgi:flagellar basal body-associated protein FliL|nr:hypothetical protein [Deltaproteobacteria bacterium]